MAAKNYKTKANKIFKVDQAIRDAKPSAPHISPKLFYHHRKS